MASFTFRKETEEFELTEELSQKLCSHIVSSFKEYNTRRQQQKDDAQILIDQIDRDAIKEIEYGKTVNTDDLYELKESFRANLRKYLNENIENFDTQGRNQQSADNAPKQKENLVYSLREMDFKEEGKKLIENFCIWGEFITYTEWATDLRQIRRPVDQLQKVLNDITLKMESGKQLDQIEQSNYLSIYSAQQAGKEIAVIYEKKFEGVRIKAVDPERFVYDVFNDNFDAALKIEQKFTTFEELLDEKTYTLDDEAIESLKPKESQSGEKQNVQNIDNTSSEKESGQIELLQAVGDIRLADGTMLRNYFVVVAGDKHVIRFEPNPYLINPYAIGFTVKNYKTKRGVSLISKAISHTLVSSYILTKMLDILALVQNPPSTGAKNAFIDKGKIEIKPGVYIEQDEDALAAGQKIEFLTHYAAALDPSFAFMEKFKSIMQEVTGISSYMVGLQDEKDRTLGEANLIMNGQQIRLMMCVDDLQDFILKNIRNLAELKANYEFGETELPLNKDTGFDTLKVDDYVRQGDYKYDYTDKRNYFERRQEADKFVLGAEKLKQMGAPIDNNKITKYWLSSWTIKDSESFIMSDEFDQMLESLPPVIDTAVGQVQKTEIKQLLAQSLQQMMQKFTQPQGIMNGQSPEASISSGMPVNPTNGNVSGLAVA